MIELSGVTKLYGRVIGVNDLCITLPTAGYGLIGPNGSGKTTLISLLIGHLRPTLGQVQVFGVDPGRDRSVLRRIGLCPASDVLYPNVSALEWVTYQVRLHGFPRRDCDPLARTALATVGMTAAMNRPMGTYSLGMRQRTKIAQAIAHQPDLLILDEPYNGLDPVGRADMTRVLQDWTQAGRGLIFASHVLQEIESVTMSFLLIQGGRLLASGTADEIDQLLLGQPMKIVVKGPDVRDLLSRLAEVRWVDSLELKRDRESLAISVNDAGELYRALPAWVSENESRIEELSSPDGDLSALFESLLKQHRGETV
ncbi:MAG: ABC transporter ATP-binding protein [Planctomycetota bacterium]